MTHQTKAIIAILDAGYKVYFPIGGLNDPIVIEGDSGIIRCKILPLYHPKKGSPLVKLTIGVGVQERKISLKNIDCILATNYITGGVWLIPISDIETCKVVRLGHKWDCYRLTNQNLEPDEVPIFDERRMEELREETLSIGREVR